MNIDNTNVAINLRNEPEKTLPNGGVKEWSKDERLEFYPQFCLDCLQPYVSKEKIGPCPCCGSENVINYERKIYRIEKQKEI